MGKEEMEGEMGILLGKVTLTAILLEGNCNVCRL